MKDPKWIFLTLFALLGWGLWGFFGKIASKQVSAENILIIGMLTNILLLPFAFFVFGKNFAFRWNDYHYYFAVMTALVGIAAVLCFYLALRMGEASKTVVITSLYPIITVVLAAIFLGERFTSTKAVGIVLAMAGIILLSI